MSRKTISLIAVFLGVLFFSGPAFARLAAVGPVNPLNGFPLWYQDTNGVTLDLPVPPIGTGDVLVPVPPTQIFDPPIADPLDPTFAFSQQIGFGTEAFYYIAESLIDLTGGGLARLVMGVEAAFGNAAGAAISGDQVVFSRLRVRVDIPATGAGQTYTVRHPYGFKVYTNVPAGVRGINDTVDIGLVPLNFSEALTGSIGPFLTSRPDLLVPPGPPVPAGWIGDGVNLAPVTGSPVNFNKFRIEGTDIGGPGVNFVESDLFMVSGHIFTGGVIGGVPAPPPATLPLTVDKVTFSRDDKNTTIDIFATSALGATVTATIPGIATPVSFIQAGGILQPALLGTVTVPNPFTLPLSITVNASLGADTNQVVTGAPVDVIIVTRAEYRQDSRRLFVYANSSDLLGNPALSIISPFVRPLNRGRFISVLSIPPTSVTLQSAAGGTVTVPVIFTR